MERFYSRNLIIQKVEENAELNRNAQEEKRAKRKRIVFIRRMVALSFLMVGLLTMVSFANGLFDEEIREEKKVDAIAEKIAKYDQVEVFIREGDRAWNIQEQLTPGKDVRDMLYLVKKVNNRKSLGDLKAGEVVTFLKTKEAK